MNAPTIKPWENGYARRWPRLIGNSARIRDESVSSPQRAFDGYVNTLMEGVIVRGSAIATDLGSLVGVAGQAVAAVEDLANRGVLSFADLNTFDAAGVFASVGLDVLDAPPALAAAIPAVQTSRKDERVHYHWHRAMIALALDVPAAYRAVAGYERHEPIPFRPRETFEHNVQGFLAHLAGAIEHRAAVDDCLPAWNDLLRRYWDLYHAKSLDDATLLWAAWVLQHRIAGQPIGTVADFLHESIYGLAG